MIEGAALRGPLLAVLLLTTVVACGDPAKDDTGDTGPVGPVDADRDGHNADTDCDDNNAEVFPGAKERCNGIDDDCDGLVDDEDVDVADEALWYQDEDGDGYGDPGQWVQACEASTGTVADGSDCDDVDATVHPGAEEVCDGLDQDCDDEIDETCAAAPQGELSLLDQPLRFEGGQDAPIGYSMAGVGDVDGDGFLEAALGGIADVEDVEQGGALWLVNGPLTSSMRLDVADAVVTGETERQRVGYPISGAGDLDGDGLDDLLFGIAGDEAAAVFYGPITGSHSISEADAIVLDIGDTWMRSIVSGGGDLTGDGVADVVVSDPEHMGLGYGLDGEARVYAGPLFGELGPSDADVVLYGHGDYHQVGKAVAGAGDLDGDGFDDLAVMHGDTHMDVYLQYGPFEHDVDMSYDYDANLVGMAGTASASKLAAWGPWQEPNDRDLNGDGSEDFVVGGSYDNCDGSGRVWCYFHAPSGDAPVDSAELSIAGEDPGDYANRPAWAGDLDQDGHADLAIGADDREINGMEYAGAVYVLYGPFEGGVFDLEDADAELMGASEDAQAGWSLSGAGDITGDIYPDLLIGAYGETLDDTAEGVVWVIPGGPR